MTAFCTRVLLLSSALLVVSKFAVAHEDEIAQLVKVERVYATPKPLGQLRVAYSGPEGKKEQALIVECDLFKGSVAEKGLSDLPRPDWEHFVVAYSLTSFEAGKWTERPYIYIQVSLGGPEGKAWEQTWVTFHFDADGKLLRRIKRCIPNEATNSISVVWKEWQIGSGISAEAALAARPSED